MKKGTIPLTNIIFHIFQTVAFSKETVNIEIWTIFVLFMDISGSEGRLFFSFLRGQVLLMDRICDDKHKKSS